MFQSADALGIGISKSGQRFIVKASPTWHELLPASEWICHSLAHYLDLAVPPWARCLLPYGTEGFGSRLEGNVIDQTFIPSARPDTDNPSVVSGTYVLDLFVANADRHQGQWLVTESGGARLLRPIDFSRAWFRRWPLGLPPFGPGCSLPPRETDNSAWFYDLARENGIIDKKESMATLEKLREMPKATWRHMVLSIPSTWIKVEIATELINWWYSPQWNTRLTWIENQL